MHHHRQGMFRARDANAEAGAADANDMHQAVVEVFLQQVVAQALQIIRGSPPSSPPPSPPRLRPAHGA
jgi:hypothetical protein